MSVDLGSVAAFVSLQRERLQAEKQALQESQGRVKSLASALMHRVQSYTQEDKENNLAVTNNAECLPVDKCLFKNENFGPLHSLFAAEEEFFPFGEDEGKRKRLAQERRQEYNAFLKKKEESVDRKSVPPTPTPRPRSILEAVDYERVLARMRAQEAQFRNVNRAEANVDRSASVPVIPPVQKYVPQPKERNVNHAETVVDRSASVSIAPPVQKYVPHPIERNVDLPQPVVDQSPPLAPVAPVHTYVPEQKESSPVAFNRVEHPQTTSHVTQSEVETNSSEPVRRFQPSNGFGERRGGGGEPVRDSTGNLITTRAYATLRSEQENFSRSKQMSYREELRRQIEEKRALEAEIRRRLQEEEEAVARRAEQQQLQMMREYEEEQMASRRKNEQRDLERLRKLEEFKMREAAQRQKRAPPLPEPRTEPPPQEPVLRSGSPPVPAVRLSTSPLLVKVTPENVMSSLSDLRRTLLQGQPKRDTKNSYEVMNRRTVLEDEEDTE